MPSNLVSSLAWRLRAIPISLLLLLMISPSVFGNPNLDPTNANFGKVTGQNNLPRNVQIGLKLIF